MSVYRESKKLYCPTCEKFCGVWCGETYPEPSSQCCRRFVEAFRNSREPTTRRMQAPGGNYGPYKDDTSPGWDNAVRAVEQ